MKVILSAKEARILEGIMEKAETGSVDEINDSLKRNSLVKVKVEPFKNQVEVTIKDEYMEDFLEVYERYIGIFVNQIKSLYEAAVSLQEDIESVVLKHVFNDTDDKNKEE